MKSFKDSSLRIQGRIFPAVLLNLGKSIKLCKQADGKMRIFDSNKVLHHIKV